MSDMDPAPTKHAVRREPSQLVHWIIALLLGVIAIGLWADRSGTEKTALAQTHSMAGARGIFAFTGQLNRDSYGLFMIDVDQGTLWCYEIVEQNGVNKLRLVAGRTFIYDRYLKNYNIDGPSYQEIQRVVARERQTQRTGRSESDDLTQSPNGD